MATYWTKAEYTNHQAMAPSSHISGFFITCMYQTAKLVYFFLSYCHSSLVLKADSATNSKKRKKIWLRKVIKTPLAAGSQQGLKHSPALIGQQACTFRLLMSRSGKPGSNLLLGHLLHWVHCQANDPFQSEPGEPLQMACSSCTLGTGTPFTEMFHAHD